MSEFIGTLDTDYIVENKSGYVKVALNGATCLTYGIISYVKIQKSDKTIETYSDFQGLTTNGLYNTTQRIIEEKHLVEGGWWKDEQGNEKWQCNCKRCYLPFEAGDKVIEVAYKKQEFKSDYADIYQSKDYDVEELEDKAHNKKIDRTNSPIRVFRTYQYNESKKQWDFYLSLSDATAKKDFMIDSVDYFNENGIKETYEVENSISNPQNEIKYYSLGKDKIETYNMEIENIKLAYNPKREIIYPIRLEQGYYIESISCDFKTPILYMDGAKGYEEERKSRNKIFKFDEEAKKIEYNSASDTTTIHIPTLRPRSFDIIKPEGVLEEGNLGGFSYNCTSKEAEDFLTVTAERGYVIDYIEFRYKDEMPVIIIEKECRGKTSYTVDRSFYPADETNKYYLNAHFMLNITGYANVESKLLPPYLEEELPPIVKSSYVTDAILQIPYTNNPGVVLGSEAKAFSVRIKNFSSNEIVETLTVSATANSLVNNVIVVALKNQHKYTIGQYYKCQIAYIDVNGREGFFSTVGFTKCTTEPRVAIQGLNAYAKNVYTGQFTGVYDQTYGDTTEKLLKGYFTLYYLDKDEKEQTVSSGELLYYPEDNKKINYATQSYNFNLEANNVTKISYTTISQNGIQKTSPIYELKSGNLAANILNQKFTLFSELDKENSTINLYLKNNGGSIFPINEIFVVSRAKASDNFIIWEELGYIQKQQAFGGDIIKIFSDKTYENGEIYEYSIQNYYTGLGWSERLRTRDSIQGWMEYPTLFDGERMLKIMYNPKLETITSTLPEEKIETIGSQFPFVIRSGYVRYKEIPLGGLLSYTTDLDYNFRIEQKIKLESRRPSSPSFEDLNLIPDTSCYSDTNILEEQKFKMQVVDWLNNGKPKLYRSPTEGSYLIYTVNVALQAETTLGNLLHNFTATGYEIDSITNANLKKYGIISLEPIELSEIQENAKASPSQVDSLIKLDIGVDVIKIKISNNGNYIVGCKFYNKEDVLILQSSISSRSTNEFGLSSCSYIVFERVDGTSSVLVTDITVQTWKKVIKSYGFGG